MASPAPVEFSRLVELVCQEAISADNAYLWLYPSGSHRGRHGEQSTRQTVNDDGSPKGVSDLLVSQRKVRQHLESAARKMSEALGDIKACQAFLNDTAETIDRQKPFSPPVADVKARYADRGELKQAQEAKVRRHARAQESGDWSEITG